MVATRKEYPTDGIRTLKISPTSHTDIDCFYAKIMGYYKDVYPSQMVLLPTDTNKMVKILGELGVNKVRIAGAEPLLRKDAAGFVKAAHAHKNIKDVRMITNGTNLKAFADGLRKMGLKKIELVHFDTFNFMRYQRMTGKDCLYRVLDGIEKIEKLKYNEIVLNIMLLNGINNDEIVEMARMTRDRKLHIRFIEYFPRLNNTVDPYEDRAHIGVNDARKMIENYQALEHVYELDQESDTPSYRFKDAQGKVTFYSRHEQERDDEIPYLHLNPNGMLSVSAGTAKPLYIIDQVRKDFKDVKFRKAVEKLVFSLRDKSTVPEIKTKTKSKPSVSAKRKSAGAHSHR